MEASIPCAAAPHVLWVPTVTYYYSVPALIFLVTPVFLSKAMNWWSSVVFRLLVECFTKYCMVNESIRHFRALQRIPGGTKVLYNEGNCGDPLSLYLRSLCLDGEFSLFYTSDKSGKVTDCVDCWVFDYELWPSWWTMFRACLVELLEWFQWEPCQMAVVESDFFGVVPWNELRWWSWKKKLLIHFLHGVYPRESLFGHNITLIHNITSRGKSTKEAFSLIQGPSIVLSIKERKYFFCFSFILQPKGLLSWHFKGSALWRNMI